jgi:hypothetical protein
MGRVPTMPIRPSALVLPVLTTLLLAACGGGGGGDDGVASLGGGGTGGDATATTTSPEEREEAMLDWAACMREHGLDVPDPQVDADGRTSIIVGREAGDDDDSDGTRSAPPDRAAFEAAQEECGDPPAFGGELSEEDRKEMQERALEFAACMRDNGAEDFPDPDFSGDGPGAGPQTTVERFDDDDDATADGSGPSVRIAGGPFGEVDLTDPAMAAAFETCQEEVGFGPGGKGGPPVAAATATTS